MLHHVAVSGRAASSDRMTPFKNRAVKSTREYLITTQRDYLIVDRCRSRDKDRPWSMTSGQGSSFERVEPMVSGGLGGVRSEN